MIAGSEKIKYLIDAGKITIKPFNIKQLNSASYDIRLANKLLIYKDIIDAAKKNEVEEIDITGGYELSPGKLYLGSTIEKIGLRDWVGELGGKSSIGRLGISVHVTAGFIDPGFYGNITLEIWVVERAIIYPGMRIGQIWFTRVDGDYDSYSKVGHYREELANGVVASMSWKQIEEDDYENRESNDIGDR
jgi:dCTP deaminase